MMSVKSSLSYVLINVYNDVFYKKKVEYKDGELWFYRKHSDLDGLNCVDELLSIEKEIIEVSFLIEYLKKTRLIYIIDDNTQEGNYLTSVGGFIKDGLMPIRKALDKTVCSILDEAMNNRVFVSTDLIQLVNDNFKTLEERALEESRKQTKYSRWSFMLALLALVISMIAAFFTKNEVTLNEGQFKQLTHCDETTSTVPNDSLTVDAIMIN